MPSASGTPHPDADPALRFRKYSTTTRSYTPRHYPDHGLRDPMDERGRAARGFYLSAPWLRRVGAAHAAQQMQQAHLNAVVIDVKDDWGQVLYPTKIPLAQRAHRPLIRDLFALVQTFHQRKIYVIARIVCFKDSHLPYIRPDLAVRVGKSSQRILRAGAAWLDAYAAEVNDYLIDIAREVAQAGVDEIQFDYVRFPKGRAGRIGRWLHRDQRTRLQVITDFLERADRALQLPLSVDLYGITVYLDGDARRLGQSLSAMAPYVEAVSPMMYAKGMAPLFPNDRLTKQIYRWIHCGLWRARDKLPNLVLRPYLQAYKKRVPFFGPSFIDRQVRATYRAGADGFLFWNATMNNQTAYKALRSIGRRQLDRWFGSAPQQYRQPPNLPAAWCERPRRTLAIRQPAWLEPTQTSSKTESSSAASTR